MTHSIFPSSPKTNLRARDPYLSQDPLASQALAELISLEQEASNPKRARELLDRLDSSPLQDRGSQKRLISTWLQAGLFSPIQCFDLACRHGLSGQAKQILDTELSTWSSNDAGESPLHVLAKYGLLDLIKKVLPNEHLGWFSPSRLQGLLFGDPLACRDGKSQNLPIHTALLHGHWSCARELMKRGSDMELQNARGENALSLMLSLCPVRELPLSLQPQGLISKKSLLESLIEEENFEELANLAEDHRLPPCFWTRASLICLQKNKPALLDLLLELSPPLGISQIAPILDQIDPPSFERLLLAGLPVNPPLLVQLLEAQRMDLIAILIQCPSTGLSLLLESCSFPQVLIHHGMSELLPLVQEKGMDLAKPDAEGYTPLQVAARQGDAKAIEFLLEAGVEIFVGKPGESDPLTLLGQGPKNQKARTLLESAFALQQSSTLEKFEEIQGPFSLKPSENYGFTLYYKNDLEQTVSTEVWGPLPLIEDILPLLLFDKGTLPYLNKHYSSHLKPSNYQIQEKDFLQAAGSKFCVPDPLAWYLVPDPEKKTVALHFIDPKTGEICTLHLQAMDDIPALVRAFVAGWELQQKRGFQKVFQAWKKDPKLGLDAYEPISGLLLWKKRKGYHVQADPGQHSMTLCVDSLLEGQSISLPLSLSLKTVKKTMAQVLLHHRVIPLLKDRCKSLCWGRPSKQNSFRSNNGGIDLGQLFVEKDSTGTRLLVYYYDPVSGAIKSKTLNPFQDMDSLETEIKSIIPELRSRRDEARRIVAATYPLQLKTKLPSKVLDLSENPAICFDSFYQAWALYFPDPSSGNRKCLRTEGLDPDQIPPLLSKIARQKQAHKDIQEFDKDQDCCILPAGQSLIDQDFSEPVKFWVQASTEFDSYSLFTLDPDHRSILRFHCVQLKEGVTQAEKALDWLQKFRLGAKVFQRAPNSRLQLIPQVSQKEDPKWLLQAFDRIPWKDEDLVAEGQRVAHAELREGLEKYVSKVIEKKAWLMDSSKEKAWQRLTLQLSYIIHRLREMEQEGQISLMAHHIRELASAGRGWCGPRLDNQTQDTFLELSDQLVHGDWEEQVWTWIDDFKLNCIRAMAAETGMDSSHELNYLKKKLPELGIDLPDSAGGDYQDTYENSQAYDKSDTLMRNFFRHFNTPDFVHFLRERVNHRIQKSPDFAAQVSGALMGAAERFIPEVQNPLASIREKYKRERAKLKTQLKKGLSSKALNQTSKEIEALDLALNREIHSKILIPQVDEKLEWRIWNEEGDCFELSEEAMRFLLCAGGFFKN